MRRSHPPFAAAIALVAACACVAACGGSSGRGRADAGATSADASTGVLEPDEGDFAPASEPTLQFQSAGAAIDAAVDPAHPPSGFKGLVVGYVGADGVPVYRAYGKATLDGSVPLDEHTLMGI